MCEKTNKQTKQVESFWREIDNSDVAQFLSFICPH